MEDLLSIDDDKIFSLDELEIPGNFVFQSEHLQNYRIYSEPMKEIFKNLKKMASSLAIPLMVTGHTGSGKELIARFMHYEVDGNRGEYVAINCTNVNKEMFESELFGYSKGAFTGARDEGHEGYLQQAKHGTLFLDEISEIDTNVQAKLLRLIEEGEFYRLGSSKMQQVECRMIFASNRNLEKMVQKGQLREDLYYRLSVVTVSVPSLIQRKQEILPLIIFFVKQLNQDFKKHVQYIQGKVLKFMHLYNWPGNIRELKNFITQIMIFIEGDTIRFEHFEAKDEMERRQTQSYSESIRLKERSRSELIDELLREPLDMENFTMDVVRKALKKFNGNKSKTAQYLGLKREQLYNRYKID